MCLIEGKGRRPSDTTGLSCPTDMAQDGHARNKTLVIAGNDSVENLRESNLLPRNAATAKACVSKIKTYLKDVKKKKKKDVKRDLNRRRSGSWS